MWSTTCSANFLHDMFPRPLLYFGPVFVSLKCVELFLHVHWPDVLLLSDYQVELVEPMKINPFKKYEKRWTKYNTKDKPLCLLRSYSSCDQVLWCVPSSFFCAPFYSHPSDVSCYATVMLECLSACLSQLGQFIIVFFPSTVHAPPVPLIALALHPAVACPCLLPPGFVLPAQVS